MSLPRIPYGVGRYACPAGGPCPSETPPSGTPCSPNGLLCRYVGGRREWYAPWSILTGCAWGGHESCEAGLWRFIPDPDYGLCFQ
jgi:hypothetical protein